MTALMIASFILLLIGFCILLGEPDKNENMLIVLCFTLGMVGLILRAVLPIFL